ncbi:MAG: transcriptional repressor NrdR [Eubacteriaceae bacterium]|nr:transcriptional repressor NrdR [Eubacteriaceae bacterium]
MKCPYCDHEESKVIDSRPVKDGEMIRRRRSCFNCEKRFTTYERIEVIPLMVIKRSGQKELFNRQNVLNGMLRACEKRPVSKESIEHEVRKLEKELYQVEGKEVTSQEIGERVMAILLKMDQVAYVRFASVYRKFADVDSFLSEIAQMVSDQ